MTKTGHQLTGLGAAAIALGMTDLWSGPAWVWLAALAAFFGSTAPDWLEMPYGWDHRKRLSVISHRTITHWVPLWLILMGFGIWQNTMWWGALAGGFATGGLVHLAMDWPNPMGIPFWTPNKRSSLHWWKSGQNEAQLTLLLWSLGFLSLIIPGLVLM